MSRDDRAPPSPVSTPNTRGIVWYTDFFFYYPENRVYILILQEIHQFHHVSSLPVHDQNHPNLMALLNQEEILMLNVKNVNVVSVNDKEENARESVKDNYNVNVNAKRSVKENVSVKESVKERFVKENVKKQHNKFQHPKRKWNSVSAQ